MKIAFLILCHKNPHQINLMLEALDDEDVDFYIHVDKKSTIKNEITRKENVFILSEEKRLDIKWGQSQMINATLNLILAANKSSHKYDYYWFTSGQDFPIRPISYIKEFLDKNQGTNYIDIMNANTRIYKRFLKRNELKYPSFFVNQNLIAKVLRHMYILLTGGPYKTLFFKRKNTTGLDFYFGSSWWILTNECIDEILKIVNKDILDFFKNSICPDESLYQTLFMGTSFVKTQQSIPLFLDWSENGSHPKTLDISDYDRIMNSNKLFARKFDENIDNQIIEKIYHHLKMKKDY